MRVLVSGASGMIGSALVDALRARGDEVAALVRRAHADAPDVAWDPDAGTIDTEALAAGSFDAVVHFAGESLDARWTDEQRERILHSRVRGTATLARAIADLERQPDVLAVASATGFYGDRGTELLVEDSPPGDGFLAGVVRAWEDAAEPARAAGIRTVHVRMGVVQTPAGSMLAKLLLPFRLGLGGPVGRGDQYLPCIGLAEALRIWMFVLDRDDVAGPVNAVIPTPCTNRDHAKALGRVLGRPVLLAVPPAALKLAYGSQLVDEMLLASQKVVPARLEALGYEFLDRTVEQVLRRELDR